MVIKCVRCLVNKTRIWTGRKTPSGSKVYRDGSWKRWNGHECPDCVAGISPHPADGRGLLAPEKFVQDPLTDRRCRQCKKRLPASKYYYHEGCFAKPDYRDMSTEYQAHYGR